MLGISQGNAYLLQRVIDFSRLPEQERRSQVEPRCAERWHLCDDEQFDLAVELVFVSSPSRSMMRLQLNPEGSINLISITDYFSSSSLLFWMAA